MIIHLVSVMHRCFLLKNRVKTGVNRSPGKRCPETKKTTEKPGDKTMNLNLKEKKNTAFYRPPNPGKSLQGKL